MIKSRMKIDTDLVKKINEEAKDWEATCRRCKMPLKGTLKELRAHMEECHGEQG